MITGKDIIALGHKPAKWFKEAIAHANANNLSGDVLKNYLESVAPKALPIVEPFAKPKYYHKNIKAETEEEKVNVDSVLYSMDAIMKTPTIVAGGIMPDACPTGAGHIPVGGVAICKNAIHPAMHSADICCSVMMTNFGRIEPKKVLDAVHSITHFGIGGREEFSSLPKRLEEKILSNKYLGAVKSLNYAKHHLGSCGNGNHFNYVGQSKNTGQTILVTHFGSRGFGANLYKTGMMVAEKFRKEISPKTHHNNAWIPYDTEEGKAYWEALQIIRDWTKLNHSTIHDATLGKLSIDSFDRFWNEHNFVFKDGNDLFYHAKGATPLDNKFVPDSTDGLRLIPLNMSQPVLIVRGETTENNLGFAPHGAGRNMSRSQHTRNKTATKSVKQIFEEETKNLDVRFYSGNVDVAELPSAYKNAESVRRQMQEFNLGEVVDEILPFGCLMAGEEKFDWKELKKRKNEERKKIS